MHIRAEYPADTPAIHALITAAFATAKHSSGTEADIVDALREADALTISLVAEDAGAVIGHVAFSPVTIDNATAWYGLGPVAVSPGRQRKGVGNALIRAGLDQLKALGAAGCVLLGDPNYYRRFGFASDPKLFDGNVPSAYFQRLVFTGPAPVGEVTYHPAFE